ncbi:MAG: glycine cleavage system protein H [Planctomycetes bacterium]|nr:glycine cleavage system protein H [Planctomycetota bacterium]
MAALLAILTFAFFITLEWVVGKVMAHRRAIAPAAAASPAALALPMQPVPEPVFVAGYALPSDYHYHRGHAWVRVLGPDTAAVGIDDFARRLVGRSTRVALPKVGSWLRQGAKALRIGDERRMADMLAPVEGTVVAVNPDVTRRPSLCTDDPYGHGWLFKLQSPNLAANLRNLLSGRLARKWIEDAREQLELRLMALSGSVLQDGGAPASDFAEHLDDDDWKRITETFLLTEGAET